MLRFVSDLSALRQWVSLGLARLIVAGITTLGALLALALIHLGLAVAVASVLGLGTLLSVRLGQRLQHSFSEARRRRSTLAANVNEKIAALPVVQAFGQTHRERRLVARHSRRLKKAMLVHARTSGAMRAVIESSTALSSGVILLLGAHEVAADRATPGMVVAAMTIAGLLMPILRDLGRTYEYWQGAQVARRKIQEFLSIPRQMRLLTHGPKLKAGAGCVVFQQVGFTDTLRGITATAPAGSIVMRRTKRSRQINTLGSGGPLYRA